MERRRTEIRMRMTENGREALISRSCEHLPVLMNVCTAPAEHPLTTTSVAATMPIRYMRFSMSTLGKEEGRVGKGGVEERQ